MSDETFRGGLIGAACGVALGVLIEHAIFGNFVFGFLAELEFGVPLLPAYLLLAVIGYIVGSRVVKAWEVGHSGRWPRTANHMDYISPTSIALNNGTLQKPSAAVTPADPAQRTPSSLDEFQVETARRAPSADEYAATTTVISRSSLPGHPDFCTHARAAQSKRRCKLSANA